jgi:predicted nucleotidyltransferase
MLSPNLVRADVIPEMVRRIVEKFHPVKIISFGSYARGEEHRHSDVDLLVDLPSIEDEHKSAVSIRRELSGLLVPKDIVVTTPEELARRGHVIGTIFRPALMEGKVLYERPLGGPRPISRAPTRADSG